MLAVSNILRSKKYGVEKSSFLFTLVFGKMSPFFSLIVSLFHYGYTVVTFLLISMIDYLIIAIIAFSVIVSLLRGFVREVLSLASWVVAFIIASRFYPYLTPYLIQFSANFSQTDTLYSFLSSEIIRNGIAIVLLFVVTLIVGGIVNYLIAQLVDKTGLSGTDRVLGGCFGFLRGLLIVAAILFFVDTFTNFAQHELWRESKLIPHFGFIVEWFFEQMKTHSSFLISTL